MNKRSTDFSPAISHHPSFIHDFRRHRNKNFKLRRKIANEMEILPPAEAGEEESLLRRDRLVVKWIYNPSPVPELEDHGTGDSTTLSVLDFSTELRILLWFEIRIQHWRLLKLLYSDSSSEFVRRDRWRRLDRCNCEESLWWLLKIAVVLVEVDVMLILRMKVWLWRIQDCEVFVVVVKFFGDECGG